MLKKSNIRISCGYFNPSVQIYFHTPSTQHHGFFRKWPLKLPFRSLRHCRWYAAEKKTTDFLRYLETAWFRVAEAVLWPFNDKHWSCNSGVFFEDTTDTQSRKGQKKLRKTFWKHKNVLCYQRFAFLNYLLKQWRLLSIRRHASFAVFQNPVSPAVIRGIIMGGSWRKLYQTFP